MCSQISRKHIPKFKFSAIQRLKNLNGYSKFSMIAFFFKQSEISKSPLPECEAVVNLAGENILNPLKR